MKRCPTEAGGCDKLVDFLFDSGLCASCDAAVKRGTAAVTGTYRHSSNALDKKPPATASVTLCKRGCGKPRHRGKCASTEPKPKCKRFKRGDEPGVCARCGISANSHYGKPRERYPKVTKRARTASADTLLTLERLRSQYTDEHAALTERQLVLITKLEVLDELAAAIKGGNS